MRLAKAVQITRSCLSKTAVQNFWFSQARAISFLYTYNKYTTAVFLIISKLVIFNLGILLVWYFSQNWVLVENTLIYGLSFQCWAVLVIFGKKWEFFQNPFFTPRNPNHSYKLRSERFVERNTTPDSPETGLRSTAMQRPSATPLYDIGAQIRPTPRWN